jgi:DNA-binding NarL/FixJ family response regulator
MTLRVVIADDHGIVREGLGLLLTARGGYDLVGTAATGREAVRAAVTLRPDVLVMDLQVPELTGVDATREISRVAPEVAVLMLTMFDDDDSVFAAMRAGARGYVLRVPRPTTSSGRSPPSLPAKRSSDPASPAGLWHTCPVPGRSRSPSLS